MAATLTVLLARTFYVLMIIVGSALIELPFPFTPRQNSILAFVTVGVPILVLALWVKPVPSRTGLLVQTLRISIPLSLGVVAVALPVYATALLNGATADVARTMLTTIATFMGIGALILIPVAADDEGRVRMPAWMRTAILVGALTITYLVILVDRAGSGVLPALATARRDRASPCWRIAAAWTWAPAAHPSDESRPACHRPAHRRVAMSCARCRSQPERRWMPSRQGRPGWRVHGSARMAREVGPASVVTTPNR